MDVAIFGTMEEEDNVFESFDGEPGGVAVEMANAEGFARRRNGSLAVGGSDIREKYHNQRSEQKIKKV